MSPEMPLDSWDRLQLPLQMGRGLSQIQCHPTQPEQTPEVAKDTSNGRRQPCTDNWDPPHPSSHKSHAPLCQRVSGGVPRPWRALLSRYPPKSRSYHLRKKNQNNPLLRHRWISCILSLGPNLFPFFFLTSGEKWASEPSLNWLWLSQIHLQPDCQAEINQELFPPFLHLFPTWTFHSSTYIRTVVIYFYSLTTWELGI